MSELENLQAVLGKVSGEDFNKTIDDKIDNIKRKLKRDAADWVFDMIEKTRQPLKDLTRVDPSAFSSSFRACTNMLGCKVDIPTAQDDPGEIPTRTMSEYTLNAQTIVTGDGTTGGPSWDGAAARAFTEDFIKFYAADGQASLHQFWLLAVLELLVEAHQAVYTRTRDDVKKMLETAEAAAENLDGLFKSPDGTSQLLITTVAAVAAVAVTVAAPPAGAAVGLTLFAAMSAQTASVFGAIPKDKPQPQPFDIQAANPGSLATSMQGALGKIKSAHDKAKDDVKSTLSKLSGFINQPDTRNSLIGPKVNGGTTPVVPGPNGTTTIAPGYREQFIPPVH